MLFDLRAPGRRRTVKVVYVGLAIIFMLSFVGLGIGGGFGSGGIFSAFTGSEATSGTSYASQVSKYKKLAAQQPTNAHAWEQLLNAQLHEAGGEAYVTREGLTGRGKALYAQIADSWNHYLALNPRSPNVALAKEVLQVFTEEGLNQPSSAVQVLQILVAAEPNSPHYYSFLADYAYKAKNTRVGDLAAEKAVSLAPAEKRAQLRSAFAALKKNPNATESAAGTSSAKTYTVKGATTPTSTAPSTTTKK